MKTLELKNKTLTNDEKLKNLSEETKTNLIEFLVDSSEIVNESLQGFTVSTISEWYKIYVTSDEFKTLSKEMKIFSFEQYESLKNVLEFINYFMVKNEIGVYNSK